MATSGHFVFPQKYPTKAALNLKNKTRNEFEKAWEKECMLNSSYAMNSKFSALYYDLEISKIPVLYMASSNYRKAAVELSLVVMLKLVLRNE